MPQRRFTLRLTEEEFRELSRIKGLIGTTTTNKAVRYIINHFVTMFFIGNNYNTRKYLSN